MSGWLLGAGVDVAGGCQVVPLKGPRGLAALIGVAGNLGLICDGYVGAIFWMVWDGDIR